ncbi:HAD-superfamily phosphatase, subfamily IIIC/FkbH-like domain-containing protein [Paenibacillus uliginis N3/975]|uniref:HAD-superfamily phosphatase, subfamily IIIC/FkbH-like domain-containing protein n=1 Tax=Paenibacillus uliginis N3/975 TaxID=1313296 RepID=A0A1X7HMJ9_9BACL|nr:HAD-IIIC family phosphatase [Paenibacillus uliginis]SMF89481.1 HAD-superfamily phosphatase, subfamily IIIC/FkbH-like domain-containing protein [Paenibacillus uliginis N3/975]
MNHVLTYLDLADSLLCSIPTRAQIAGSPKLASRQTFQIRVDRTMPFEFIANLMPPFCRLWEADVDFDYSDYDAALTGFGGDLKADVFIIWMDWRIYLKSMTAQKSVHWLQERIEKLRDVTNKPIWVNNWPESLGVKDTLFSFSASDKGWFRNLNAHISELIEQNTGCVLIDLAALVQEGSDSFYDYRNEEISNYPFSNEATIIISRHLGVHLLPATFSPRLKAIALDLDDTLYNGVLGEEGAERVSLTEGHHLLQRLLLRLKQSGILLTLCSRNEEQDVKALFGKRDDFPLKWDDFAAVCANWRTKTENLDQLAQILNIDPSAFLFVDDNPAELIKMAATRPEVHLLRAKRNGQATMNGLCHYPGLYQLHPDDAALSRTTDIQANQRRERIRQEASDYNAYLDSLEMRITVYENDPSHVKRLYELSRKTNQFNLALRRMTESEVNEVMDINHYLSVTISLSDVLSDSGIIGAFVCRIEGEQGQLIETLFSCRALGREIETVTFAWVLEQLITRGVQHLNIDTIQGPRNAPALDWLKRFVGDSPEPQSLKDLLMRVKAACRDHPAKVEVN